MLITIMLINNYLNKIKIHIRIEVYSKNFTVNKIIIMRKKIKI